MKKFFKEFKDFVMRGNVLDLSVAVIVGAAFQAIVKSLTDNIISPIIGLFTRMNFDELALTIPFYDPFNPENSTSVVIKYGAFITAVINFLIMAFVIFLLVKGINKIMNLGKKKKKEEEPAAPTTKECPFCMSEIDIRATRCKFCTAEQPIIKIETESLSEEPKKIEMKEPTAGKKK
ncbi:MAG: large conductance mechanosensitive channel protein MscL [Acutalibacteraceae bacterium]